METEFRNEGFGWYCVSCESIKKSETARPRLLKEGEQESSSPEFSAKTIAKWTNSQKDELVCPLCGLTGPPLK